ncbi:MAG: ABC transporter permease [Deltaproteobacteria bacterium]|nr:ABC transporter permease [Deltaproteobacteria bacterium]
MNAATESLNAPDSSSAPVFHRRAPRRRYLRIFGLETRAELMKMVRMPAFVVPAFAFPLMFYALFGLAFGRGQEIGPVTMLGYLLATYGAFGVIGANLFSFGVGIAVERGQGWMLLKRAMPLPPLIHFLARMVVGMVFSLLILVGLFALGGFFGGVALPLPAWVKLAAWLTVGGLPFAAFGLFFGYLCGPNSAPAVINLLYLPLSFASGLWMPYEVLPGFFKALAPWLPAFHLAQQGLGIVGAETHASWTQSIVYLSAFTVVSLVAGIAAYRRDQESWG